MQNNNNTTFNKKGERKTALAYRAYPIISDVIKGLYGVKWDM